MTRYDARLAPQANRREKMSRRLLRVRGHLLRMGRVYSRIERFVEDIVAGMQRLIRLACTGGRGGIRVKAVAESCDHCKCRCHSLGKH